MKPYRARRVDNNKEVFGSLVERNCDGYPHSYIYDCTVDETEIYEYSRDAKYPLKDLFIEVHPDSVSQSTDRKDKHGVEIYGGMKLKTPGGQELTVKIENGIDGDSKFGAITVEDCEIIPEGE